MKTLRMLASGFAMLLILGLVNFYIGYHGWLLIDEWFSGVSSAVFWTLFILIAFAYVIGMISWPKSVKPIARFFKVIGSYYLACMEFAIITLPLADLLYVILGWSGIDRTYYIAEAGGTILILLAVFLVWGSINAWSTVIRTHSIPIDKSIGTSTPLTIAVASDLHLGNIVGNRHLKKWCHK